MDNWFGNWFGNWGGDWWGNWGLGPIVTETIKMSAEVCQNRIYGILQ
jgi:hypothetical protein